jgi:hypothetical protein
MLSLRGAQRRGNPATVWATPMFLRCHCEERSDAAIQSEPSHPVHSRPPLPPVVIARSAATRQSSDRLGNPHVFALSLRGAQRRGNPVGTIGQPPHRPGIPHNASDWIATSVLFETFLAMTALGQASENRDAPPLPFPSPLLSLRGAPRRGNPATVWASPMFLRCHCEERRDAAIQSEPSGIPPHRPGIPHNVPDWIATSVLFETFLGMTAPGQASENRDATPRPFPSPLLSLR